MILQNSYIWGFGVLGIVFTATHCDNDLKSLEKSVLDELKFEIFDKEAQMNTEENQKIIWQDLDLADDTEILNFIKQKHTTTNVLLYCSEEF